MAEADVGDWVRVFKASQGLWFLGIVLERRLKPGCVPTKDTSYTYRCAVAMPKKPFSSDFKMSCALSHSHQTKRTLGGIERSPSKSDPFWRSNEEVKALLEKASGAAAAASQDTQEYKVEASGNEDGPKPVPLTPPPASAATLNHVAPRTSNTANISPGSAGAANVATPPSNAGTVPASALAVPPPPPPQQPQPQKDHHPQQQRHGQEVPVVPAGGNSTDLEEEEDLLPGRDVRLPVTSPRPDKRQRTSRPPTAQREENTGGGASAGGGGGSGSGGRSGSVGGGSSDGSSSFRDQYLKLSARAEVEKTAQKDAVLQDLAAKRAAVDAKRAALDAERVALDAEEKEKLAAIDLEFNWLLHPAKTE